MEKIETYICNDWFYTSIRKPWKFKRRYTKQYEYSYRIIKNTSIQRLRRFKDIHLFSFFKRFISLKNVCCSCVSLCVAHSCRCLQRLNVIRYSGTTAISQLIATLCGCWELNPGLWKSRKHFSVLNHLCSSLVSNHYVIKTKLS